MAKWIWNFCLLAGLLVVLGVAGVRFEFLPVAVGLLGAAGFSLLMLLLAVVALLVILFKLLTRRSVPGRYWATFLLGAAPTVLVLATVGPAGFQAPGIHDITTDTENPPAFELAAEDRDPGDHPVAYQGAVVAGIQKESYPRIQPLRTAAEPERALAAAEKAMIDRGWRVLGVDRERMAVEAVVESAIFGFEDDVSIRVTPVNGGSRIDVRSASRVGQGDLGANARRVKDLLADLGSRLP